ncbi:MAG: DUF2244 domain-containing protein [Hyphomicrobiaceae bacterium]
MRCIEPSPGGPEPARPDCLASFEIWPHRSLGMCGTMALLGAVALGAALIVARMPAPAVLPLATSVLITVGALALALWCNNRAARKGELIEVGPKTVRIVRLGPHGPENVSELATAWVRVVVSHDRQVASRITLRERGHACSIGECLSPDERKSLAEALSRSLAAARRSHGGNDRAAA